MLPAYFANMAPVIVRSKIKLFNYPIDFGKKIKGKDIFGRNKTFRGFVFGVLFAVLIAYLQFLLFNYVKYFKELSFVDYSNWLIIGFLFGFGSLFGDLVKSFIKRQLNIKPGNQFIPWDQLDFVIGALFFISIVTDVSLKMIFFIILISFVAHILVNHSAFYLKIRDTKW